MRKQTIVALSGAERVKFVQHLNTQNGRSTTINTVENLKQVQVDYRRVA